MNKPSGAARILELVEGLKLAVEDFAARSEKLNADLRTQLARERQRHENALSEETRQAGALLAECEATFQAAKTSLEARFQRRAAWIGKAYQNSKESILVRIEDRVGARKYELQKTMMQAEKDREKNLAAAAGRIQDLKSQLAHEQQTLGDLEFKAQKQFRGCPKFSREFLAAYETATVDGRASEEHLLAELRDLNSRAAAETERLGGNLLFHCFKHIPLWVGLALVPLALVPFAAALGLPKLSFLHAAAGGAILLVVSLGLRFALIAAVSPRAKTISATLSKARKIHDVCLHNAETHHAQEVQHIHQQYEETTRSSEQRLKQTVADAGQQRVATRMKADEKTVRVTGKNEALFKARMGRLQQEYEEALRSLRRTAEVRTKASVDSFAALEARLTAENQAVWTRLEEEWNQRLRPVFQELEAARTLSESLFPSWTAQGCANWNPPSAFAHFARVASLGVDVSRLCDAMPKDKRLGLPGPFSFSAPLCAVYPAQGSVVFETAQTGHDAAIGALNNLALRLLSVAPPGRLHFTVIDPVGLGQNFAGVMHLADYEEQLINSRIWTQASQIEQKLADLNEHMEKVIQMYLRNEYATIAEYNEQAGVIAEKYHFLVVADFPVNFTDVAARRLLSIAASGAKCGVYMLLHWDRRQPLPQDFLPDELRRNALCLAARGNDFVANGKLLPGTVLSLDAPPEADLATEFTHRIGRFSRDSSRVEVPFDHVAPADAELWSVENTNELRVPIGRTGATKFQYLAIGKGTCQHGLIAGKTGSGKSTLFHVLITNLSLWCSPDEVEFYLVDFKKGVEFKCYAANRLPHARVVAIESDREFGLSVLQKVDDELRRRGDLFRNLGAQDLAGFKRAGGTQALPRCLLIIDEFQEFFVEDDKIAQTASLLLDRIVRQGRAFGIHVLLGSQTLGGAYTVARTTLGQMVIRIALQCNEADAYLIMDDNNPAPRLLSRPGEGIYNDTAGTIEGNSPFQVVWLPDEVRERYLAKVRARADQQPGAYPGPIVFEGNVPANVTENAELSQVLASRPATRPVAPRIWLGAPNSIKGPTAAVFHRQSGNNLLVVGQRDEAILGMISLGLVSLAAQFPAGSVRLILCDATPPGTSARDYLDHVLKIVPQPIEWVKPSDLPDAFGKLATEMAARAEQTDAADAPPVFLFIHGLQRFSRLRFEEDFGYSSSESSSAPNPGAILNNLLAEGTRLGIHVIATCDTYNTVNRFLSRKALSEFEMRVLFQMSANDSASLIDNPKAGALGLHRALFSNSQEGYLETFRPYALPGADWLDQCFRKR